MRNLYRNGVWAIFSTLDPRVLQFKPGLLITQALSEELLTANGSRHRSGPRRSDGRQGEAELMAMDSVEKSLFEVSATPTAIGARSGIIIERAAWAADAFRRYDRRSTIRIVEAVAEAARSKANSLAEAAVRESGRGVARHKRLAIEATCRQLEVAAAAVDLVSPRLDRSGDAVELPRPVGIVVALLSAANPVADLVATALMALAGRNAVIAVPAAGTASSAVEAARLPRRRRRPQWRTRGLDPVGGQCDAATTGRVAEVADARIGGGCD